MMYTYNLIEARISMKAGKITRKNRKNQIISLRKQHVFFSFLSRLEKSNKMVSVFFFFSFL